MLMTSRAIRRAIRQGHVIVLSDNPWHTICPDLFGVLVVESRRREPIPTRLATLTDKRKAVVFDVSMLPKRSTYKRKAA